MSNFLDSDSTILENNLRFVKNDVEEELENLFGNGKQTHPEDLSQMDHKIVQPTPGICVKSFKVNTNEKFFINICQTDSIPAPEDITEEELSTILNSDAPSSYRIPMSISEPRTTPDKSGNIADVCDIAINPKFLKKCDKNLLFRDFLIAIILEALSDKYNAQIKTDNWVILKNRKCMGNLVKHRIQNRDVKKVHETYKNKAKSGKKKIEELKVGNKKLIQEIDPIEAKSLLKNDENVVSPLPIPAIDSIKQSITLANSEIPEYNVVGRMKDDCVEEIIAEFLLPKCISANEIVLDIGEDRILLESMKHGYLFDKFVDYSIDQEKVSAKFDKGTKMLRVNMPVLKSRN